MRIRVDLERCQGHSRCYSLAPEVFDVDDEGFAHVCIEGDVPALLQERAALAAANCPERAISVEE
jgi:ferredoxin